MKAVISRKIKVCSEEDPPISWVRGGGKERKGSSRLPSKIGTKMNKSWCGFLRFNRAMAVVQIALGVFFVMATIHGLQRSYFSHFPIDQQEICERLGAVQYGYADFNVKSLSERIDDALTRITSLQEKLQAAVQRMDKDRVLRDQRLSGAEFRRFVEEEVMQPLYRAHVVLGSIRVPRATTTGGEKEEENPLINYFTVEEIKKYIRVKKNRHGKLNVHGVAKTYNSIGHACVVMKEELEQFMNYDVGSYCNDDWNLGQKLILHGCDPLPRRRCLARASRIYQVPFPINESMWRLPDHRNVRWSKYRCGNFTCLAGNNPRRGFSKCASCFELEKEKQRWVANSSLPADFTIGEVLGIKPGEIRIGLDVSIGTGTFAARMRERNVTIISTAMNIGAPFSEMISLRGLVPLYVSLNQRLPFFDNTMDLIHTTVFLDGWVELQLLDFILFDWDRVLRPGGLLWIDKFFCNRKDLHDYMDIFLQFKYKKHRWVLSPKSKEEVYLSALLEKPPRPL